MKKAIGAVLMGASMAAVACGDSGGGASGGDDSDAGAAGSGGFADAGATGSGGSGDAGATGSGGSGDAGAPGSGGSGDAGTTGSGGSGDAGAPGSGGSGDAGAPGSGGSGDAGAPGSGGSGDAGATGTGGSNDAGTTGSGGSGNAGTAGSAGVGIAGTAGSAGSDTGGAGGTAGSVSTDTGGSGGGSGTGTAPECPDIGLDPNAGAIYYACDCGTGADSDCVAGDDGNAGTLPDAPWRTWEYARTQFANLSPGDSIAFCRGGAFDNDSSAGTRWVNAQCQADNPCIVRDYDPPWGAGDEPRPRINTMSDQHGFALEDGGNSNHEEGYTFLNLELHGYGTANNGFFIYNDIDDVLICNVSIDGYRIGVHAAGSNPPEADSDARNERINVLNSSITNNPGQGWLGACNGCGVDYTYFDNNGSAEAVYNHNIYFSGASGEVAVGMHAIGNELYRSAIVNGECAGVSFVVHGEHDGLLIENNLVREDVGAAGGGCWGIAVDTGYGEAELFRNVVIRGNRVVNVGNVSIGLNACESCVVENNVIIQEQAFGSRGIAAPNRDRDSADLAMTGVTVRNNSIYFGPNSSGTGIYLGGEGTSHVLVSNAVHYAGANDGWNCFDLDLALSSYDAVDNNLCYFPDAPGGEWMNGAGTLADWQSSSSLDASSIVADPSFVATTGPDFDLSPGSDTSPLVDSGHATLSSSTDLTGASRDASPDIGAYER